MLESSSASHYNDACEPVSVCGLRRIENKGREGAQGGPGVSGGGSAPKAPAKLWRAATGSGGGGTRPRRRATPSNLEGLQDGRRGADAGLRGHGALGQQGGGGTMSKRERSGDARSCPAARGFMAATMVVRVLSLHTSPAPPYPSQKPTHVAAYQPCTGIIESDTHTCCGTPALHPPPPPDRPFPAPASATRPPPPATPTPHHARAWRAHAAKAGAAGSVRPGRGADRELERETPRIDRGPCVCV